MKLSVSLWYRPWGEGNYRLLYWLKKHLIFPFMLLCAPTPQHFCETLYFLLPRLYFSTWSVYERRYSFLWRTFNWLWNSLSFMLMHLQANKSISEKTGCFCVFLLDLTNACHGVSYRKLKLFFYVEPLRMRSFTAGRKKLLCILIIKQQILLFAKGATKNDL